MSRISGESEPLMRRASESLSVRHVYDKQRRTFRVAVCEERARAAAGAGASRQARGVIISTIHREKKQGRVCERSGMEASASEPECSGDEQSRPIFSLVLLLKIALSFFNIIGKALFFYHLHKRKSMENFANFIVDYIEKNKIHGVKGWFNQLQAYHWETKTGIERYSDGLLTSKKFKSESQKILNIPNNNELWFRLCDDIRTWGGMKKISPNLALSFKKSVIFLSKNNPGVNCDFMNLPIIGERIATASKIYYYTDPLLWTIYDSRVGYAIHQLIFEYAKMLQVSPSSLFVDIPICLPDSQTNRRNPVYPVSRCQDSEIKSKGSFIWASHLHRVIASKLNEISIQKPSQHFSAQPQWELPHVEMVFFVIGDRKWIDAPDILGQGTPPLQPRKRGDYVGTCPWCGHPVKVRESQKTGELYEGCTNFPACHYKGNRSY